MVVGCRTQQLLKNGKNVSFALTSCMSMYSPIGVRYKNYVKTTVQSGIVKDTVVRLYCDCRRFYSTDYQWPNEIKASFSKLTAQEVSAVCVIAQEDGRNQKEETPRWQALLPSQLIEKEANFHLVVGTLNNIIGAPILESRENGVFFNGDAIKKQFNNWLGDLIEDVFEENPKRQEIQELIESKVKVDLEEVCNTPLVQFGGGDKIGAIKNTILKRKTRSLISKVFSLTANVALRPVTSLINKTLKEMLIVWFNESYDMIGKVATFPIRVILEKIINSLLPCKACPSLVGI